MSAAGTAWTALPPGLGPAPVRHPRRVLETFLAVEFLCQLALLVPVLNAGPLRILWRVGLFAFSLALIPLLRGKRRATSASVAAFWVMALLTVELFHPDGNTLLAVLAQWAMYLAVLAPLFWMPRLEITPSMFRRVLLLFWAFYSLSAFVGLLQAYYPGRFQPQLSPYITNLGQDVQGLRITLASGAVIYRPMGLSDIPGGAATAGMWAVLMGLGFLLALPAGQLRPVRRGLFLLSMLIGASCIYLSQVRVLLVVVVIYALALLLFLGWRRRWRQFALMALLAAVLGGGSWRVAARVGGSGTVARVGSIAGAQKARATFAQERGGFLRQTFYTLIPEYPLGAGLGRWGMMNTYFGDNTNPARGRVYVEIQWQGWVLDGGIPLLLAYLALLGVTMLALARIARRRGPIATWALLCLAFDIGMLALSFDYTPFTAEMGLEFWFINALVLAAAAYSWRQARQGAVFAGRGGSGRA